MSDVSEGDSVEYWISPPSGQVWEGSIVLREGDDSAYLVIELGTTGDFAGTWDFTFSHGGEALLSHSIIVGYVEDAEEPVDYSVMISLLIGVLIVGVLLAVRKR